MKKKFLVITLCLVLVLSSLLLLSACNKSAGTKEEWNKAFASSNFDNVEVCLVNSDLTNTIKIDGNKSSIHAVGADYDIRCYEKSQDGIWYTIFDDEDGAYMEEGANWTESVRNQVESYKDMFEDFIYDSKAGVYKTKENSILSGLYNVEVKIENSKISYIKTTYFDDASETTMSFSNYGKTSVTVPDVTQKEPEDVQQNVVNTYAKNYFTLLREAFTYYNVNSNTYPYFDENLVGTDKLCKYLDENLSVSVSSSYIFVIMDEVAGPRAVVFTDELEEYSGVVIDGKIIDASEVDEKIEELGDLATTFVIEVDENGVHSIVNVDEEGEETDCYREATEYYSDIAVAYTYYSMDGVAYPYFDENLVGTEGLLAYIESSHSNAKEGSFYVFMSEDKGPEAVIFINKGMEKAGIKGTVTINGEVVDNNSTLQEMLNAAIYADFAIDIDANGNYTLIK